ncbi:hypothetical protein LJB42_002771 [Komagataella kurtzmanii]|nr:hypothetical protein LJB42_002771 [Komagataella kurtzmanii]
MSVKSLETTPLITTTVVQSTSDSEVDKDSQVQFPIQPVGAVDEDISIWDIPNIFKIELALFTNVFVGSFEGTVTSSTYAIISNEFDAVNIGSIITIAYLITSTSFQPLYGSLSDVLGRRFMSFFAIGVFSVGSLFCGLARDIYSLFFFRAITGIGGAGIISMSTIINSDVIPRKKRGLFQSFQNIMLGVGSIIGASLGGLICDTIGWRWCFIILLPMSLLSLVLTYLYVSNPPHHLSGLKLSSVDIKGSVLLVVGLSLQLIALYSRTLRFFLFFLFSSSLLLFYFIYDLSKNDPSTIKLIPWETVNKLPQLLTLNFGFIVGFANFANIYVLPLLFQLVLNDSATKAGLRLAIPSFFTSVGALITGYVMNKNVNHLNWLIKLGFVILILGTFLNSLITPSLKKYVNFIIIPNNIGLGIAYPASLFLYIFLFPNSLQASSTTTLLLARGVGQVWGMAGASVVVAHLVKFKLWHVLAEHKKDLDLTDSQIADIIEQSSKSLTYVRHLPENIAVFVHNSYKAGLWGAQMVSIAVLVLGLLASIFKDFSSKAGKKFVI